MTSGVILGFLFLLIVVVVLVGASLAVFVLLDNVCIVLHRSFLLATCGQWSLKTGAQQNC